ncbi:zinc finger CCHC domain-containing protein 8 homolog [Adelges cooleyi]|uniref:zinc finger CCHC domain-containing protein 8 homolog n=1 Tax=Adelges cooleyi TaxID=133065 RepID=UPI00217F6AA8|nr:zinc finger CCHC domain-containing protein 8 homolog [Adelges cooleyi]
MSAKVETMDVNVGAQTSAETQQPKDPDPLFTIDKSMHSRSEFVIPIYDEEKAFGYKKTDTSSDFKPNSCWNCGSTTHALNSCSKRKNQRTISRNKQAFMEHKRLHSGPRQRTGRGRFTRYYLEDFPDEPTRWNDYVAGKLSRKLLSALNVPKNGLPLHIYKMRKFGYPSAWLEEAKVKPSGISLYIDCNKSEPIIGEDGKIDTHDQFKIDMRKLWKYPGFNTPCPPGTIDEHLKYNCPAFDPNQSLENMCEHFKDYKLKPYSRTKLSFPGVAATKKVTATVTSATVTSAAVSDQENPPCEKVETAPVKNPVESSPSSLEEGEIVDSDNEVLEETKPKITDVSLDLDEIPSVQNPIKLEPESVANVIDQRVGETPTVVSPEKKPDVVKLESDSAVTDPSCDRVENNGEKDDATSSEAVKLETPEKGTEPIAATSSSSKRKYGELKNEISGTPVLKRFSPYANRPSHEKFAKGMVDIIEHDTLPGAVGTFNKLKEILKDVRIKLDNAF